MKPLFRMVMADVSAQQERSRTETLVKTAKEITVRPVRMPKLALNVKKARFLEPIRSVMCVQAKHSLITEPRSVRNVGQTVYSV